VRIQFFDASLQIDIWVMVYLGGFGFHPTEIIERFGTDNLTIFLKVGWHPVAHARGGYKTTTGNRS
jgi:hypothetical protein